MSTLNNIIDTHAHMDDPYFLPRIEEVLKEQSKKGVAAIVASGSEIPSSIRSVELAEKYGMIYASVGIYPNETRSVPEDYLDTLRELAKSDKTVAIGEIGLDYAFDPEYDKEQQAHYFREQLELARELDLPVVIHNREADEDMLEILKEYHPKGVIHRISSSPEYAREFLNLGLCLGIGPQITYAGSDNLKEIVRTMPLEQLVLETDAPFLPTSRMKDKKGEPYMIATVAKAIARERDDVEDAQEVLDIASMNSRRIFGMYRLCEVTG